MAYSIDEVAADLRKTKRWLIEFLLGHPECYYKAGRTKLFDDRDVARIKAILRADHEQKHRRSFNRAWTNIAASPSTAALLEEALALCRNNRKGRRRSSRL